ncbi:MAG: hypothetical protein JSS61_02740 [Verrucomicrobia bacterium]|nr:hypothetical protein [Verrucomicrobiota bacterium]
MRLTELFQASAEGISSGLGEVLEESLREIRILFHHDRESAQCVLNDCDQIRSLAANYLSHEYSPRTLAEYGELVALQIADLPSVKTACEELSRVLQQKAHVLEMGNLDIFLSSQEGRITTSDEITKALSPLFFNAVALLASRGLHLRSPLGTP